MSSMTYLSPDRTRQGDFFIADICEASPKDDFASMEHPLFALRAGITATTRKRGGSP